MAILAIIQERSGSFKNSHFEITLKKQLHCLVKDKINQLSESFWLRFPTTNLRNL